MGGHGCRKLKEIGLRLQSRNEFLVSFLVIVLVLPLVLDLLLMSLILGIEHEHEQEHDYEPEQKGHHVRRFDFALFSVHSLRSIAGCS